MWANISDFVRYVQATLGCELSLDRDLLVPSTVANVVWLDRLHVYALKCKHPHPVGANIADFTVLMQT